MHIAEVAGVRWVRSAMAGGREERAFSDAFIPPGATASDFSSACYNKEPFGFCMLQ